MQKIVSSRWNLWSFLKRPKWQRACVSSKVFCVGIRMHNRNFKALKTEPTILLEKSRKEFTIAIRKKCGLEQKRYRSSLPVCTSKLFETNFYNAICIRLLSSYKVNQERVLDTKRNIPNFPQRIILAKHSWATTNWEWAVNLVDCQLFRGSVSN